MILWRHLNNDKSLWVYHPTKEDADKALERMAIEYCPTIAAAGSIISNVGLSVLMLLSASVRPVWQS